MAGVATSDAGGCATGETCIVGVGVELGLSWPGLRSPANLFSVSALPKVSATCKHLLDLGAVHKSSLGTSFHG